MDFKQKKYRVKFGKYKCSKTRVALLSGIFEACATELVQRETDGHGAAASIVKYLDQMPSAFH